MTDGCHFPDDIFKCILLNEIVLIATNISLNFVLNVLINNIPALVQIMACCRPGNKPLSEPMMFSLLTYMHHSASISLVDNMIPLRDFALAII